jgi:hypothetical protein
MRQIVTPLGVYRPLGDVLNQFLVENGLNDETA